MKRAAAFGPAWRAKHPEPESTGWLFWAPGVFWDKRQRRRHRRRLARISPGWSEGWISLGYTVDD